MSDALLRYRSLERKLIHTRWINQGYESDEEEALLEDIDEVWWQLTDAERNMVNKERPKSLIRLGPPKHRNRCTDADVLGAPGRAPRVGKVA